MDRVKSEHELLYYLDKVQTDEELVGLATDITLSFCKNKIQKDTFQRLMFLVSLYREHVIPVRELGKEKYGKWGFNYTYSSAIPTKEFQELTEELKAQG